MPPLTIQEMEEAVFREVTMSAQDDVFRKVAQLDMALDIANMQVAWCKEQINALLAKVNNPVQGDNDTFDYDELLRWTPLGPHRHFLYFDQSKIGLGFRWDGSNKVTIFAGSLRIPLIGNVALAETAITLAESTEWIYVSYTYATSTGIITQSATEPASTALIIKIPLFKFGNGGSGTVYELQRICNWGDVLYTTNPDSLSLAYNVSGQLEIDDWTGAVTVPPDGSSLFHYQGAAAASKYSNLHDLVASMLSLEDDQFDTWVTEYLEGGFDNISITQNSFGEWQIASFEFATHSAPSAGSLLPYKDYTTGGVLWTNYSGMDISLCVQLAQAASVNKMADGSGIGSSDGVMSVDADLRQLSDSVGTAVFDWATAATMKTLDGCTEFDFDAETIVKIANSTAWDGAVAPATGALQIDGGFNFLARSGGSIPAGGGILARTVDFFGPNGALYAFPAIYGATEDGGVTRYGILGTEDQAGYFADAARVMKLCDDTYAANATGGYNTDTGYYHNGDGPFVKKTVYCIDITTMQPRLETVLALA